MKQSTNQQPNKGSSKFLPKEEKEFLDTLLRVMPKQWQDFFNAYKTAKPFMLHSLYRLTQMKAEILARGDEKAWDRLVERELEMLKQS